MAQLTSIDPREYPSLFVPLKAAMPREPAARRSKWERLVTQWRRHRLSCAPSKVPRLAEVPSRPMRRVLSYLAVLVTQCTPNRPSQLQRSVHGNTLVVTGFHKLYFARCVYLLESARRFDPLLSVDCFVYLGARALCFTLSK